MLKTVVLLNIVVETDIFFFSWTKTRNVYLHNIYTLH